MTLPAPSTRAAWAIRLGALAPALAIFVQLASSVSAMAGGQDSAPGGEVRQIVTFLFQPGRSDDALALYEQRLLPIYADLKPLARFRAYREAESPEPLDLVVVSAYKDMAGMDDANGLLRQPHRSGQSAFQLYGELSRLSVVHHDQFVEMIAAFGDRGADDTPLTVFEYLRVTPGAQDAFERLLATRLRPFERERSLYRWSETGRMLVADGWDYLRLFGVRSLGEWHTYRSTMRTSAVQADLAPLLSSRKTLILRAEPRLAVR